MNFYWPSGDSSFTDFPPAIKCINPDNSGLELLGSPVWGPPQFFITFLSTQLDKISAIKLADLENPQVELPLFRSCMSVCKITHILCCVLYSSLGCFPSLFDDKLCACLSRVMHCSISDDAWLQATLPFI